jgi:Tfp pilus assembly protein PilE
MSIDTHTQIRRVPPKPGDEAGFTMIIALMVMLVTSLLLVAAFTAAKGDVHQSHTDLTQKQAYYAALAGVQEYEYTLEANPDIWETCPKPGGAVPGEASESYEVTTLAASTSKEANCNTAKPFESIIESKGALANTFRIKSVGKAGKSTRSIVANFQVAGFLNYIYFTQYEDQDPSARNGTPKEQKECENYRPAREKLGVLGKCGSIVFGPEDTENGPLHTDDTAVVCGGAEFGRPEHVPPDSIEMLGGALSGGCGSGSAKYNTASGEPSTVGPELVAPESDSSLHVFVEHTPQENEFMGRTYLELEGKTNEIKVTTWVGGKEHIEKIEWPKNGLIYVRANEKATCEYAAEFEQTNTDTPETFKEEENCGSVYVKGTFSKALTVSAEQDVIVNGSITPYGVTPPAAPASSNTATIGLIATRFIRVYHPCPGGNNGSGAAGSSLENPWIYAAILSTDHSFIVDNYNCGKNLGNLNIFGAIGQKFRGIVGLVGGSGYVKEYIYDERLATDEPPYFLAPLKAGWKIARETAPNAG